LLPIPARPKDPKTVEIYRFNMISRAKNGTYINLKKLSFFVLSSSLLSGCLYSTPEHLNCSNEDSIEKLISEFDLSMAYLMIRRDDTQEWINRGIPDPSTQLRPVIQSAETISHDRDSKESSCMASVDFVINPNQGTESSQGEKYSVHPGVKFYLKETSPKSSEVYIDGNQFYESINDTLENIANKFKDEFAHNEGYLDFNSYQTAKEIQSQISIMRGELVRLQHLDKNTDTELAKFEKKVEQAKKDLERSELSLVNRRNSLTKGESVSYSSDIILLGTPDVSIKKGSFDREAPQIDFTVQNQSESVISSIKGNVYLYIDGELESIADRTFYGTRLGGARGLKPGQSDTVSITNTGMFEDEWRIPAILNAEKLAAEVIVTEIADDRENSVDFHPKVPEHLQISEMRKKLRDSQTQLNNIKSDINNLPERLANTQASLQRLSRKLDALKI